MEQHLSHPLFLAYEARFQRREERANKAIRVICQFRDTNSKDAGRGNRQLYSPVRICWECFPPKP